jgi:esterase/lipase superfamily enzyme
LLEQAESLALRRMTVSQLDDSGSFRFFYASNRRQADANGDVGDRFTSERIPELSFGSFDTRIEPTLGLGMLLNASDWFLNEEIRILDVQELKREAMLDRIGAQVQASPYRSLLVVVHGFREAFPSALRKTAFLSHVLDINMPVMVFDWPGDQGSSLRGYRRARNVARESAEELARLLKGVVNEVQPERLWLIANSMGAEVVVNAFHSLHDDPQFSDHETEIENVILTAPDVGHAEFNKRFWEEITDLAGNTTIYVSSNDRALLVSRLINRSQRLGESRMNPDNTGQVMQTSQIAELLEPGDRKLSLVDVTPVNRTWNFHNFSLETPEFFNDLFLRLTRNDMPTSRELYFLETPDGVRYFVLTRGR